MADRDPSASSSLGSGSAAIIDDEHEVKGLTFATIRAYLLETQGKAKWDAIAASLPRRTREICESGVSSQYYPESDMRRLIRAVYEQLAMSDDERFKEIFRGVALAGINRWFRMILSIASGRFVLRNIPTFWKRLRRGPATLRTETLDDGRVLIHYSNFRYCRDPLYRLLSIANCQAAVFAATKKLPKATVARQERDSMTLAFEFED